MITILAVILGMQANTAMAQTMTVAQAKQKIAELSEKQIKTPEDIVQFKIALKIISGSWARQP